MSRYCPAGGLHVCEAWQTKSVAPGVTDGRGVIGGHAVMGKEAPGGIGSGGMLPHAALALPPVRTLNSHVVTVDAVPKNIRFAVAVPFTTLCAPTRKKPFSAPQISLTAMLPVMVVGPSSIPSWHWAKSA